MRNFVKNLKCDFYENKNDLSSLCDDYKDWVSKSEYIVFKNKENRIEDSIGLNEESKGEYYVFKSIKRGNDVYRYRVRKNLKPLLDLSLINEDLKFIKENCQRYAYSPFLFVTLTYNRCLKSMDLAWIDIGKDLNLFFSKIKQLFGKFVVLRCFEAYGSDGYPHIHILMLFKVKVFLVKRHNYFNRQGKSRIKYILNNNERDLICNCWHSFIDVTAVKSFGSVGYLLKYITKNMYSGNNGLTSVCMLLFDKRSYSISKDFTDVLGVFVGKVVSRLDSNTHNSNIILNEFVYVGVFVSPVPLKNWFFHFKADDFNEIFKLEEVF